MKYYTIISICEKGLSHVDEIVSSITLQLSEGMTLPPERDLPFRTIQKIEIELV